MTTPLKFRIWDDKLKQFWDTLAGATRHGLIITSDGTPGIVCDVTAPSEPEKTINYFESEHLAVEQWTGFDSASKQPVYLNDIVRFTYAVGDFAWEFMDEAETKAQERMSGKTFVGQVVWRSGGFHVECPLSPGEHAPTMIFSASYAGGAEVVGNVHQNPDWRAALPNYGWLNPAPKGDQ